MMSFLFFLTILNMDKVKINSITGKLVNATFTFDDVRVPSVTLNLNDMTVSDGDILAVELNKIGQEYKSNTLSQVPSEAVAGSVGMEFGYVDGVIVPIIPEVPEVPETPVEEVIIDDIPTEDTPVEEAPVEETTTE